MIELRSDTFLHFLGNLQMAIAIPNRSVPIQPPKRSRFLSVTCPKICCAYEENSALKVWD
ncbi:hypothetical protein BDQ94DRAFT_139518 [Aspergillus welwitschiae]|uniref:Uncharacterized protein n=1 Tax=Aspergillus welwitschiae TaxID=1341132 RepID=A0A3F3QB68_9EURO|nr:hypothetical protein BDQ94DRAFT_139518 [Aspergillus welwitschiae]RDH36006.1 hypothetical protein BDQ94DRAFT_139518 [Aspergillus welwitschiae]